MELPPPPMFVDVKSLLESSEPRRRIAWSGLFLSGVVLTVLITSVMADKSGDDQQAVAAFSTFVMVLLIGGMFTYNGLQARAQRREHGRLEAAEELIQLRRWPQAAMLLQSILSQPMRLPQTRLQALVSFVTVLARFHRFEDVTTITEHLLETIPLDPNGVHALKLSRAMALLREDRLFDADRAISDLRRSQEAAESAGLAILEMYRDVKTGHAAEAMETFNKKRDLIRRQLGHRLSDAYVLAATAQDLLSQTEAAADLYRTATLLAPVVELHRRYPETARMAGKYAPTPAPMEVAA